MLRFCVDPLRLFAARLPLDRVLLPLDFELPLRDAPELRLDPELLLALRVPEPRPRLAELLPLLERVFAAEPLPLALDLDDLADDLLDVPEPSEAFVDADEPLDEPEDCLRVEARFDDPR